MSTDLSKLMVELNAITEGKKEHIDSVELKTSAYGLVIDKKNPKAYEANKKAAESLNLDIDNLTPEQAKEVALETYNIIQRRLSTDLGDKWNSLNNQHKLVLMDAKFNTGVTYEDYTDNALKYQAEPTRENLKNLVKESTRVQTVNRGTDKEYKERTKGLDNRVARVFNAVGLIENLEEAKELGLYKADDNIITPEIKNNFLASLNPVENVQKATEDSLPEYDESQYLINEEPEETTYRVQAGDTLGDIYDRLAIPNMSRYEFYERMFANNPQAFSRSYDDTSLQAGAVLNLGAILPESDYGDFTETAPQQYSVSEDIDYESLEEDSELFDPRLDLF